VEKLAPQLKTVKAFVAMTGRATMPKANIPNLHCYEELLEAQDDSYEWPSFDERTAACLCYTSGTTGNPRARSTATARPCCTPTPACLPDALNLSARDVILPVVPMFHVNAWGLPYSCALTGAKLVFPGQHLDGKSLHGLFEQEGVTMSAACRPSGSAAQFHEGAEAQVLDAEGRGDRRLGGAAGDDPHVPGEYGVQVLHAWGMTEMSPLGTVCTFKAKHAKASKEERYALQNKVGRVIFGVDTRIVDENGKELPHDGKAFGDLQVRGPWIVSGYFKGEGGDPLKKDEAGASWFPDRRRGDHRPRRLHPDHRPLEGRHQVGRRVDQLDRPGEHRVAHPAVQEAAVIGVRTEVGRAPIVVVVKKAGPGGQQGGAAQVLRGQDRQVVDAGDVVFVAELPHTGDRQALEAHAAPADEGLQAAGLSAPRGGRWSKRRKARPQALRAGSVE
jgi:fatty-acyl-CoA synthase